jgi:hypothetical protein
VRDAAVVLQRGSLSVYVSIESPLILYEQLPADLVVLGLFEAGMYVHIALCGLIVLIVQVPRMYIHPDDLVYACTDSQPNRNLLPRRCLEWSIFW